MRRLLWLGIVVSACAQGPRGPGPVSAVGPDSLELVVAGTTDVHGWLRGWDYFANAPDSARGLTRIATILDSLRGTTPDRVVLVDAGDDLQGTPITSIALRDSLLPNPIITAMNALRYDAAVIGITSSTTDSAISIGPSRRRASRCSRPTSTRRTGTMRICRPFCPRSRACASRSSGEP